MIALAYRARHITTTTTTGRVRRRMVNTSASFMGTHFSTGAMVNYTPARTTSGVSATSMQQSWGWLEAVLITTTKRTSPRVFHNLTLERGASMRISDKGKMQFLVCKKKEK